MKNTQSNFRILFENWKNFIGNEEVIEEELKKADVTYANDFVKNLVNSDETANFMHGMITSAIDFYKNSKNVEVSNKELRKVSKQALGNKNEVLTIETTDNIIKHFEQILEILESKYKINKESEE